MKSSTESNTFLSVAVIRQKTAEARATLTALRENKPKLEIELAWRYLKDPSITLTVTELEMVLSGLDLICEIANGRVLQHDYFSANGQLATLPAAADVDERQRLANAADFTLTQFGNWQAANPGLVEYLKVPENGEHK